MKKLIIIIILLSITLLIPKTESKEKETKAVFISYIELDEYISQDKEKTIKNIDKMINNIYKMNLNTIILQVRSKMDSIYNSSIFKKPSNIREDLDVLELFIEKANKKNIKVIAWINPYRINTTEDITQVTNNDMLNKYLNTDIIYINNGIYLNPSKEETNNIILKGVEEVLNYKVDKILFDDYFYPSNNIDIKDYNEYLKNNEYISLDDYHLKVINNMIKKVYKLCSSKNIEFGISPDGNIENNYNKHYADVKEWLKKSGYVDFIMPQVYYGFYNSTKEYYKVIKEWESLIKNESIDLYIALAFYKVGKIDNYAKEGRDEWVINNNIIMREILLSRNLKNYKGFALYRYDFLFNKNNFTNNSIEEIENMKKIL